MKKKLLKKSTSIILLIILILSGLGMTFASNFEKITEFTSELLSLNDNNIVGMTNKGISFDSINEKELEIANLEFDEKAREVILKEDLKQRIKGRKDEKKVLKIIQKVVANKGLNAKQQEKLETYMVNNTDSLTVFTLYEYLFENFFTTKDMDDAIKKYNSGINLEDILQSYYDIEQSFIPRNYPEGVLEYYMDDLQISENELAVAEILAFRGLMEFETIINRLSNDEEMSSICEELGVLNVLCKMNTINVSTHEITGCVDELGLSKDDALKKIIAAKKAKIADEDIIKSLKSKETHGKKIKDYYKKEYNK